MNKKLTTKIKALPQKPGAYIFKNAQGRILYIGKAINLRNRVRSHFVKNSDIFKGDLIKNVADIDFILTANEKEALILENELIKKYKPKYNIQWQDDKSYFWISFSNDEWPRVQTTHQPSLRAKRSNPADGDNTTGSPRAYGARDDNFIGPFVNGTELKQILRALRKILPYRTCKNAFDKPCLQWHLGLCPAHRSLGEGGPAHGPRLLPEQAQGARRRLNIDPSTSSRLAGLRSGNKTFYLASLDTLRQLLRLYAGEPLRVEAYDISNIQGNNATGSMIAFKGFKRDKSQYRKFRIKTVPAANDIAMLKEVIRRRLNHTEWPLPDLMLIDGGRPQLNSAALEIGHWKLEIPLVSLAKRDEELYTIYSNKVLQLNKLPTEFRLLFQAIRNEAHRFAITYYRHLHAKKFKRGTAPKKAGN